MKIITQDRGKHRDILKR